MKEEENLTLFSIEFLNRRRKEGKQFSDAYASAVFLCSFYSFQINACPAVVIDSPENKFR